MMNLARKENFLVIARSRELSWLCRESRGHAEYRGPRSMKRTVDYVGQPCGELAYLAAAG